MSDALTGDRLVIAELYRQLAALATERDDLRAQVATLTKECEDLLTAHDAMVEKWVKAESETDTAREECTAALATVTRLNTALRGAVNAECSCGGRGPDDDPCVACRVWHRVQADLRTAAEEASR